MKFLTKDNTANSRQPDELHPEVLDALYNHIKGYQGAKEGVQIGDVLWVGDGAKVASEQIAIGAGDCVISSEGEYPRVKYLT